jgi:16S rRNA C967 or C1407 C5-methylase (RsmB/RsmF family)
MISLPKDFIDRIEAGPLGQTPLLASLDSESPISIRLNPKKKSIQFETEEVVSWCPDGRYLKERPSFTLDPLFHAGTYYPQEAGSMYIDAIVRSIELPENPILLDLCAAPGGKSTLLASYLDNRGMLISNEIIRSRAYILAETLTKWGFSNTTPTSILFWSMHLVPERECSARIPTRAWNGVRKVRHIAQCVKQTSWIPFGQV